MTAPFSMRTNFRPQVLKTWTRLSHFLLRLIFHETPSRECRRIQSSKLYHISSSCFFALAVSKWYRFDPPYVFPCSTSLRISVAFIKIWFLALSLTPLYFVNSFTMNSPCNPRSTGYWKIAQYVHNASFKAGGSVSHCEYWLNPHGHPPSSIRIFFVIVFRWRCA